MSDQQKAKLRELFKRAIEDGDQSRAEGVAAAVNVVYPDMDLSKSTKKPTDSTVNLSDEEEYEYQRFVDLMDPQRG